MLSSLLLLMPGSSFPSIFLVVELLLFNQGSVILDPKCDSEVSHNLFQKQYSVLQTAQIKSTLKWNYNSVGIIKQSQITFKTFSSLMLFQHSMSITQQLIPTVPKKTILLILINLTKYYGDSFFLEITWLCYTLQ